MKIRVAISWSDLFHVPIHILWILSVQVIWFHLFNWFVLHNSYVPILILGCYKIKTVFSHVQDRVRCDGCQIVLCRPTGGKGKLSDGKLIMISVF